MKMINLFFLWWVFLTSHQCRRSPALTGSCFNVPDWDLAVCLHNECTRKQLYKPEILCQWIDLRATYRVCFP